MAQLNSLLVNGPVRFLQKLLAKDIEASGDVKAGDVSLRNHKHSKADISDFPAAIKSPQPVVIKFNGGTTEGTNQFTYDGSAVKTPNITPAAIGAAEKEHGTHVTYATNAPMAPGTASAGTLGTVSRGDHRHPLPTKADLGLGNVENKSSATIRGEMTKADVVKALGYTPPTQDTNTTYGIANTTTPGLVKSGKDISVDSSGTVTVTKAAAADKLSSPKSIAVSGAVEGKAVNFDGTANATIQVTALNTDFLKKGQNTIILNCGGAF